MNSELAFIEALPALQQPDWRSHPDTEPVRRELGALPPLVEAADVAQLHDHLRAVAEGHAQVVQAGDCAEDWAESGPVDVARKAAVLDLLAGVMRVQAGKPVVRVGRIAGQYTKPRSRPTETVLGAELPVYRGHMVNDPNPDPELRRPDPRRLLTGYHAAREVMDHLGWSSSAPRAQAPVWTSHEALLLDYELPLVRAQVTDDGDSRPLLASTHWPWIGERTRQVDGAHVALLAAVRNPVACKVGPTMDPAELLRLCERLDPHRRPGRLTLIARMGAGAGPEKLPALVAAVRGAGHPVSWLCDPMHGNTVAGPDGLKTRFVETVIREVEEFQKSVRSAGGIPGGLHLETTPDSVTECVADRTQLDSVGDKYTSFCDPRLNPRQAVEVASAWRR
ncbi:3-deoxy-7-phosphoheptulonate synthase [Streptomyces turgidiscabies]|uniref:Phospho-2-dehydro-3-deoxyheptonate aldolase n=1 Tax=Streptomyces turgidiscabies (strain Car8) TaxID=698760 RepID=L7F9T5_STRT8|nr:MULTISPECIES: 3-deoxy-7-phosphoheptulonate synthase [Streptomyces]ELP67811.1 class-II DAHP synthetase family protein [Streptomyces turgidiscabies Car8]MDX3494267.1 3-deoxy-7-phosphoheptulonate synthase [Streptomyces turgidiscabies]GAQ68359.1 phospho-2-dehydro-3-deoxyheptonate aldolase [Streptomyces turgidiscabies]